jgi:hypothetical protein
MGLVSSLRTVEEALRGDDSKFILSCSCGWRTRETRAGLQGRVRAHFSYPDAAEWEQVSIKVRD